MLFFYILQLSLNAVGTLVYYTPWTNQKCATYADAHLTENSVVLTVLYTWQTQWLYFS